MLPPNQHFLEDAGKSMKIPMVCQKALLKHCQTMKNQVYTIIATVEEFWSIL